MKEKEEKFKEEIHGYEDMQEQLKKLQEDEREALILWKRTMEQVWLNNWYFIESNITTIMDRMEKKMFLQLARENVERRQP